MTKVFAECLDTGSRGLLKDFKRLNVDQAIPKQQKLVEKKNANHGNRIKAAIDITHKARNQEFF